MDTIKVAVETEPKTKKCWIVIWALVHCAIAGTIITFDFLRQANVNQT